MAGLYVAEFLIHSFHSPDLDVFNGIKYCLTISSDDHAVLVDCLCISFGQMFIAHEFGFITTCIDPSLRLISEAWVKFCTANPHRAKLLTYIIRSTTYYVFGANLIKLFESVRKITHQSMI
jgi:hypothetical protein